MKIQRCKGTRDFSPEDMNRFRLIEGVFRDCCLKGGYEEIKTPTLEYLHLFTSTGTLTPGTLGKVYSFLDWDGWSGERVVLRPDGTIPVARLYIDTMRKQELAKLFYITNIFTFEETGKETREKYRRIDHPYKNPTFDEKILACRKGPKGPLIELKALKS